MFTAVGDIVLNHTPDSYWDFAQYRASWQASFSKETKRSASFLYITRLDKDFCTLTLSSAIDSNLYHLQKFRRSVAWAVISNVLLNILKKSKLMKLHRLLILYRDVISWLEAKLVIFSAEYFLILSKSFSFSLKSQHGVDLKRLDVHSNLHSRYYSLHSIFRSLHWKVVWAAAHFEGFNFKETSSLKDLTLLMSATTVSIKSPMLPSYENY